MMEQENNTSGDREREVGLPLDFSGEKRSGDDEELETPYIAEYSGIVESAGAEAGTEEKTTIPPSGSAVAASPAGRPVRQAHVRIEPEHFGETLRRLREAQGLSIDEISRQILVSPHYLEGLEAEDLAGLPPPVYVAAYIRKLGAIYGLNEEEISSMTARVRALVEPDYPDDLSKVVVNYEPSEENEEKLKHMVWGFAAAAVVVVGLLGGGIFMLLNSGRKAGEAVPPPAVAGAAFGEERLLEFRELPLLKLTALEMPSVAGR